MLTPQELNDIANLRAEWTTQAVLVAGLGPSGPTRGAAVQMAAAGSNTTAQLAGRVAGLEAAVEQLARGGGIDPAAITRAVRDGLAGAQVTVELGGGQSA